MHYIIRTLIDGLAEEYMISADYPHIATARFASTVSRYQGMDCESDVTIQLITPDGEIEYETTIEATYNEAIAED